jgi:hypothetical protein
MSDALLRVATGFKLALYGLLLVVVAVAILFFGACLIGVAAGQAQQAGGAAPQNVLAGMTGLTVVVGLLALVGSVLGLVGRCMCLSTPEEAGAARSLVTASVALEVLAIFGFVGNSVDNAVNVLPQEAKAAVALGSGLAAMVAAILFLLFTRSLARFVRRPDLAGRAMSVMWLWVGTTLFYVAGTAVVVIGFLAAMNNAGAGGAAPNGPMAAAGCAGGILVLAALVFGVIAAVLYALLLGGMSAALQAYARRRTDGDYDDDYDGRDEDGYDDGPRRRDEDEEDDRDDRPSRPWDRGGR